MERVRRQRGDKVVATAKPASLLMQAARLFYSVVRAKFEKLMENPAMEEQGKGADENYLSVLADEDDP